MKIPFPKNWLLIILLASLVICLVGCAPRNATTTGGSPPKSTQVEVRTGNPRTDWFKTPRTRLIDAVIIADVQEDPTSIKINWWEIDANGFVYSRFSESAILAGDEKPQVVRGSAAERQKLTAEWRAKGFDARLTSTDGVSQVVSNFFIQYDPPSGYIWNAPAYLVKTTLDLSSEGKTRTISFGDVKTLSFKGYLLTVQFRNGTSQSGSFTPPMFNNNPYRPNFYGVQYAADGSIREVKFPIAQIQQVEILITPGARVK